MEYVILGLIKTYYFCFATTYQIQESKSANSEMNSFEYCEGGNPLAISNLCSHRYAIKENSCPTKIA